LVISGTTPDKQLVEIIELANHPFFVGVQFHPEFKSRPLSPSPLFRELIKASLKRKEGQTKLQNPKPALVPKVNSKQRALATVKK